MTPRLFPWLAAGCAAVAAQPSHATDADQVFRRASASVVTVYALDDQGASEVQGSGVVIAAGLVATNCHVIQDAATLTVEVGQKRWEARWARRDATRDICLLSVAGLTAPSVAIRDTDTLAVGEAVFAIGNPLGFGVTVSRGLISGVAGKGSDAYLLSTAAQSPGSSGGGLFDEHGKLVGVTTATLGTGQNLNLALAAAGITSLATQGKLPPTRTAPPLADRQWGQEAEALQQTGAWKKLAAHAAAWLAEQPGSAPALVFLGMAENELGQASEALTKLEKALAVDDRYVFGWQHYALVLRSLGRKEAAEQALDRAQAIFPNSTRANELRADWALHDKNPAKAREESRKAIRLAPGRTFAWRLLGTSEDALGNGAGALAAFRVAQRLGDTSPEVAEKLSRQLAEAGKVDEASAVAAKAVLGRREAARSEISIGFAELKRARLGAAESAMRKAVELAPELPESWQGLAAVLVATQRPRDAEQALGEVLERKPDHADALATRASLRRDLGLRPAAEQDIRQALAIEPNNISALRVHAALLYDARDFRSAVSSLKRIDSLGGAGVNDLISLGDSQTESGAHEEALSTLARAEAQAGDTIRFYHAKAKAQGRSGKLQESLTTLEGALRIDPVNQWAWSSKGYALLKLGRLPEAVETLETAVRLSPDFANAWINLGQAHLLSRNLGRAIQALEKGLALAPEAADLRLYLAQAYLASRIAGKAREHANWLLARRPTFPPAHGVLTLASLLDGDPSGARQHYERLRTLSPEMAGSIRKQAIANGLAQAREWTE